MALIAVGGIIVYKKHQKKSPKQSSDEKSPEIPNKISKSVGDLRNSLQDLADIATGGKRQYSFVGESDGNDKGKEGDNGISAKNGHRKNDTTKDVRTIGDKAEMELGDAVINIPERFEKSKDIISEDLSSSPSDGGSDENFGDKADP